MALTFNQKLQKSAVASVILAEVTASAPLEAWIAYNSIYRCPITSSVTVASFQVDGAAATEGSSIANVEANAGRWIQDGAYVYYHPSSGTPYTKTTIAFCEFFFSDRPKSFTNQYNSRLKSVPRLSLRIEPTIGGVTQIGGGTIGIENTDGFFDSLAGVIRWDNGTAVIKLGLDLPDDAEEYADYRTIATYQLDGGQITDSELTLTVKERKERLRTKIPLTKFTRAAYPSIEEGLINKPIPTIYGRVFGARGYVINPNTNTLKVCNHAIKGFFGCRKKETLTRTDEITPDWFIVANETYYRTNVAQTVKAVQYNGTDLTEVDSIEAVDATADTWTAQDNFVYVRLTVPNVPTSANMVIVIENSVDTWREIPIATRDVANGEFTLSADDWDGVAEIAVDVLGKTDAGVMIETGPEMVQDILETIGETSFNTSSFTAAKAWFTLGSDRFGATRYHLKPGLYLDKEEEALKYIERLNTACLTFIYVNSDGQWTIEPIKPESSDGLPEYDEAKLLSIKRDDDTDKLFTEVTASYAKNHAENRFQIYTQTSTKLQRFSGDLVSNTKEIEVDLWEYKDVKYWAERFVVSQGVPLVTYQLTLPRFGLVLAPGDKVRVKRTRGGLDEILEVLEIDFNLTTKQATLVLGNVRGWGRSSGFWVADSQPDWDDTDTDLEARDAAGESGFWTTDNGLADATDYRSFNVSRWF